MKITLLGLIEGAAIVVWLSLAGLMVFSDDTDSVVQSINPAALQLGPSQERWMGIFFEDQHVGFSVTRSANISSGGTLFEGRSQSVSYTHLTLPTKNEV